MHKLPKPAFATPICTRKQFQFANPYSDINGGCTLWKMLLDYMLSKLLPGTVSLWHCTRGKGTLGPAWWHACPSSDITLRQSLDCSGQVGAKRHMPLSSPAPPSLPIVRVWSLVRNHQISIPNQVQSLVWKCALAPPAIRRLLVQTCLDRVTHWTQAVLGREEQGMRTSLTLTPYLLMPKCEVSIPALSHTSMLRWVMASLDWCISIVN